MLRQSSSRNNRSKKLRPRHTFQAFLLLAVGVWIVYQLTRSYGKRQAAVVEIDDGEAARQRLGRKGFVGFAGHASDDDIVGVGSDASSDDPLSRTEEGGDGDQEDQAADEDDGADDDDDADDGLAGEEEDDDRDFISQNGNSEDEMKTLFGESDRATLFGDDDGNLVHEPKELNSSAASFPRAKATGSGQDAVASQQRNGTDGAPDGRASATDLSDSSLKNASSLNLALQDTGKAGDAAKKLGVSGFTGRAAGAEDEIASVEDNRMINQKTADSVAGHGISS